MVSLPSAEQRPVLAEAALLSAELRRPGWLPGAAVSSSESAAGLASGGSRSSALGPLKRDKKKPHTKPSGIDHSSIFKQRIKVLSWGKKTTTTKSYYSPVFCAWLIATLSPDIVVTAETTAGTDTTGGLVRVTWAVCPAWAWIWPGVGTRVCTSTTGIAVKCHHYSTSLAFSIEESTFLKWERIVWSFFF